MHLGDPLKRRMEEAEPPPMTLVFVSQLLDPDWLIEVQATAVVDEIRS
jgi:enamine deaminase RidA (YjgF/YER057c/UK114 family)